MLWSFFLLAQVLTGVDLFFEEGHDAALKDKRIGILTNHTGVDQNMRSTLERVQERLNVTTLFAPEHGIKGSIHAGEKVHHGSEKDLVIYSLHGDTRRPTAQMLKNLDAVIFDIQCTGVRPYTYQTSLFYLMEEAAKHNIEVIVFDRPNPINGLTVDGPMMEEKWRSFIGYINVPYCHGMTIGELAHFFNEEYKIGCKLKVIPMKGWTRSMAYRDTGLHWIPPSPNIPEPDTPLFSSSTGSLGELHLLNIGIGFTLPFKIVGAPWIKAEEFATKLNQQNLPGVRFHPFHYRPYFGLYKGLDCEGIMIQVTDAKIYRPLSVQYLILGMLKSLYPKEVVKRLAGDAGKDLFCKASGTEAVYELLLKEKYPAWKLIELHKPEREAFLEKRKKYLLY